MRALLASLTVAVLALLAGFGLFMTRVCHYAAPAGQQADGIVVLTGGSERLTAGMTLLSSGSARRLLISGVHPRTGEADIRRVTGFDRNLFACCVDIGHDAVDTMGNAAEARAWAQAHGFKTLIVVTSTYHMPRSLAEFSRALPAATLIAYPVQSRQVRIADWWRDGTVVRMLMVEYVKFLDAAARLGASRLFGARDRREVAQRQSAARLVL
jgi:uncharacterized SAM-binding protein YcdF (DUF218 family)